MAGRAAALCGAPGPAVGRYLTAPAMGFPEDEIITEIVVYIEGERPDMGTSIDGRAKLQKLAVCNGPTFSAELSALVPAGRQCSRLRPPNRPYNPQHPPSAQVARHLHRCLLLLQPSS